jgi:hypothetical protein
MDSTEGLDLSLDQKSYDETGDIKIDGRLSTFVNCGSQYAMWRQFPRAIKYTLKDLDSGATYNSIDMTLSISEHGTDIYEKYRQQPCDQVVSKSFTVNLNEVFFKESPNQPIKNFELQAEYAGHISDTLKITNTSFQLKVF